MLGGLVEREPELELIDVLVDLVPTLPLGALEGLLDVAGSAEGDVQGFPALLLFEVLFLVKFDDVVVVPIPLEGLVGGELLLKLRRVLPNHSYKFIVQYYQSRQRRAPESSSYIMAVL